MRNKQSKRRTATCPCILSWRSICMCGTARRPTGRTQTSCSHPWSQKAAVPLSPSAFVADHLRKAAKAAGVQIQDGQRFGLPAEPW